MITGSIEWPFHDSDRVSIVALIEYSYWPASGDGYHEPREPATCHVDTVTLIRRTHGWARDERGLCVRKDFDVTITDPTPAWALESLRASADLEDAMLDDVGEIPSRAAVIAEARYDEMRGK